MFTKSGVNKARLYDSLRTMGRKHLKTKEMRDAWSEDNPTYCYCYVVSEMAYWYVAPKGTIPMAMKVPGDPGTHRFLVYPDGFIVDLTAEQFPNYEDVIYENGKRSMFMQTGCVGPSKRAKMLATLMGYEEDDWITRGIAKSN